MHKFLFALFFLFGTFSTFAQDTLETPSGLRYLVMKKGDGVQPKVGQEVKVKYVGFLENGQVFEDPGAAFKYNLGDKGIIPGWNEGIQLMREGEKTLFILPAKLGYGSKGSKDEFEPDKYVVPPNATILFEIELLKVK